MHSQLPQTIRRFPLLLGAAFLALTTACDALGPGGGDDDDGVYILDAIPAGSLVITEVQAEPNVGRPEFIEVLNTSDATVDLVGCQFVDGGTAPHDFTIYDSVVVEGGAYVLFGGGEYLGTNEGEVPIQVDWHSVITLNQGDPEESFGLFCPDGVGTRHAIDEVTFDWDVLGIRKGHGRHDQRRCFELVRGSEQRGRHLRNR